MKLTSKLLLGSLLYSICSVAQADFKTGPRLGFGLGYKNYHVGHELIYNPQGVGGGTTAETMSGSHTRGLVSFELTGGYDYFKESLYAALEANYRYSPGKNSASIATSQTHVATVPFTLKQSHEHDFGLVGHLGAKITPTVVMYGIAELRYGQFEEEFVNNDSLSSYKNAKARAFKWGYGGGLGVRFKLHSEFSLAAEATYTTYQKVSINDDLEIQHNYTLYATGKRPRIVMVMFKLHKNF